MLIRVGIASQHYQAAHVDTIFTDLLECLHLLQNGHWSYVCWFKHRISDDKLFESFLRELVDEILWYVFMDINPLYRVSWLACVVEDTFDKSGQCQLNVAVGGNICSIFPT